VNCNYFFSIQRVVAGNQIVMFETVHGSVQHHSTLSGEGTLQHMAAFDLSKTASKLVICFSRTVQLSECICRAPTLARTIGHGYTVPVLGATKGRKEIPQELSIVIPGDVSLLF
jgi:hypothetical protein